MLQCWVDPERRPSVQKLESTLMSLMSGRSVPCLTTGGNLKQVTEPVRHAQGLLYRSQVCSLTKFLMNAVSYGSRDTHKGRSEGGVVR